MVHIYLQIDLVENTHLTTSFRNRALPVQQRANSSWRGKPGPHQISLDVTSWYLLDFFHVWFPMFQQGTGTPSSKPEGLLMLTESLQGSLCLAEDSPDYPRPRPSVSSHKNWYVIVIYQCLFHMFDNFTNRYPSLPIVLGACSKWVRPRDRGNVSAYALLAKLDKAVTIILWHGWYGWLISWHSTPQTKIEKGRTWLDV
jgi:hypothetical protein